MAAIESKGLMTYVDEAGNHNILYPVTTLDAVDGLEEALEDRMTKDQVTTMINEALGVIENGTY